MKQLMKDIGGLIVIWLVLALGGLAIMAFGLWFIS